MANPSGFLSEHELQRKDEIFKEIIEKYQNRYGEHRGEEIALIVAEEIALRELSD